MFWTALAVFALTAFCAWLLLREKDRHIADLRERVRVAEPEMARLRSVESGLTARLDEVIAAREQQSQAFQALAADALRGNNQQFLHLAEATLGKFQVGAVHDLEKRQTAIDEMVRPLRESLHAVDDRIQKLEIARSGAYEQLSTQVRAMADISAGLQRETGRLAGALSSPSARGRWGEIQLRRVVELAGMLEHCDFVEQSTLNGASLLRPDLLVTLPNQRQIAVDSKVPMQAYLEALDETGDNARAQKFREHAGQIRKHLKKLGEKQYWAQFPCSPELVVAFLPGEIFFNAALQYDPELTEFGLQQNVFLATPITLIALLKAVAHGWRQDHVTRNAQEIRDLGAQLYDRVRVFADHYADVGKGLRNAVLAYDRGQSSMDKRLLATARRFEELGVNGTSGWTALPEATQTPLSFRVDDESGSETGGSRESTGTGRRNPA